MDNKEALFRLRALGLIKNFRLDTVYEEPGVEMRTSERIRITLPDGVTLTISGTSSGSSENVSLTLEVSHELIDDQNNKWSE